MPNEHATPQQVQALRQRFCTRLVACAHQHHTDNHADHRYGAENRFKVNAATLGAWMGLIHGHMGELAWLWHTLEDDASRAVLMECMLFQSLGHLKVKRACNTPAYRAALAQMPGCGLVEVEARDVLQAAGVPLHQLHFPKQGFRVAATGGAPISYLVHRQYDLERPTVRCHVEPGDTVLDCGACWGDTAVWFAAQAGPGGRVHAFEFVPENLAVFQHNLALNPHLRDRIDIVPHPVGARSGVSVHFGGSGPGTRLGSGNQTATTKSIDDLVDSGRVAAIDVIKLDVEGSEAAALQGAVASIRRFRPKLQVSVYHRPGDWWTLARLVRQIVPDYRLFMEQHTIHSEETMLYAMPPERMARQPS